MDRTTLIVRLSNAHGELVKGAVVRADLVMPSMDMGENGVVLTPTEDGTYTGSGRFSMDGDWLVKVTAVKGQEKTVLAYPVAVQ